MTIARSARFAALLSQEARVRQPYDEILFEIRGCVVTPTLGSILPYWLLVIPRAPTVSFAEWREKTGVEPHSLLMGVCGASGLRSEQIIWFEHGAANFGSPISCGVDQAHLHIIVDAPFSFPDFARNAMGMLGLSWQEQPVVEAYRSINRHTSYLVAGTAETCIMAQDVDSVCSQFFRRIVAELVEQPHAWNYRDYPHLGNVKETLRAFGGQVAPREQSSTIRE